MYPEKLPYPVNSWLPGPRTSMLSFPHRRFWGASWWLSDKWSTCQTGDTGSIPDPRDSHTPQSNSWATTIETGLWSPGVTTQALTPSSPKREATTMRSRCSTVERSPCSPQLKSGPRSNDNPAQPKIKNKHMKLYKREASGSRQPKRVVALSGTREPPSATGLQVTYSFSHQTGTAFWQ